MIVALEVRSAGLGTELVVQLLAEAAELLAARGDAAIERRSAIGDPAVTLIDIARELAADLIIVGVSRQRFRRSHADGPVSERVVQLAPCDVLVVA